MKPITLKFLFLSLSFLNSLSAMDVEETPSITFQISQEVMMDLTRPNKKRELEIINDSDTICKLLPYEVISLIFDYLTLKDLFQVRLTCSTFKTCSLRTDPNPFSGGFYPVGWILFYPNLKYLQIKNEYILKKKKAQGIIQYLAAHPTFQSLYIQATGIGCEEVESLSKMLIANKSITSLNLLSCQIGTHGANCLAEMLKKNSVITSLNLRGNWFGNFGVKRITTALKENTTLTCLKLAHLSIGFERVEAMESLSELLAKNTSIKQLALNCNEIDDTRIRILIPSLKKNQSLTSLDLSNNRFSEVGIQALCEMLATNSTLIDLNLQGNPCGIGAILSVAEMLLMNSSLKSLFLSNHYAFIHPNDIVEQSLIKSLRKNTTLKSLHLPHVFLNPEQASEFGDRVTLT